MDKRYQVFVSSTYVDLREARDRVFKTVMEMDCIPAGMELFPAIDEEAWEFIKRIIDDSDYYLIILGARYGSTTDDGISFTEKEYDYAVSKSLKVLAFVHNNPDNLPARVADGDPVLKEKLAAFRQKVAGGRLVSFWDEPSQLPGLVALSLAKTIKLYPAVGWVRADQISSETAIREQNALLKEVEALRAALKATEQQKPSIDIAGLEEKIAVQVSWTARSGNRDYKESETVQLSWLDLFTGVAPDLQRHPSDGSVNFALGKIILYRVKPTHKHTVTVNDEHFKTIRVQLMALGLVNVVYSQSTKGDMALFWSLTKAGFDLMMASRTVKSLTTSEIADNAAQNINE